MKSIILSFFFSWKSNQPILRDKSNKITKHKNSKITQGWIPSQQIWEIRDTFSLIATTSVCTSGSELDSVKCLLQESSAHNQSFKGLCFTHTLWELTSWEHLTPGRYCHHPCQTGRPQPTPTVRSSHWDQAYVCIMWHRCKFIT